jgi:hypothetical protein
MRFAILFWTISGCETKSAGSYSIADRATQHAASAQQSVHLTLGILRSSQAVFYASAFFQLDGFAVPAPAQVTQTVGLPIQQPKEVHFAEQVIR